MTASTRIVIAIPSRPERSHRRAQVEAEWRTRTCQPVDVIFSEAGTSWGDGLNDIWAQVRDPAPALVVCGSDDMMPADDNWLPPIADYLARGAYPAPRVDDPRFVNYGGHPEPVADGTPSDMSSFPVLHGMWGDTVFPLPEGLHYFCDNAIAVLLGRAGIPCVAVPSSRIVHLKAREGRGAGMGDEDRRMLVDSVRYSRALAALGVDRAGLPAGQRGPLWESHWLERGRAIEQAMFLNAPAASG